MAALGDPIRLGIVDGVACPTDRRSNSASWPTSSRACSPITSMCSSRRGMILRSQSSGDGRRRYVHLVRSSFAESGARMPDGAAAGAVRVHQELGPQSDRRRLWRSIVGESADSAGTHYPHRSIQPGGGPHLTALSYTSFSFHLHHPQEPHPPRFIHPLPTRNWARPSRTGSTTWPRTPAGSAWAPTTTPPHSP